MDLRLCGLAHGASGVALAFEALAAVLDTGDAARWRAAARRGRDFERMHFSSAAGSWADLRPADLGVGGSGATGTTRTEPVYPHLWCHGSVGVVAERLGALEHDPMARTDAAAGLAAAQAHARSLCAGPLGPGAGDAVNGSLCHGLAGLAEVFLDASLVTGDDRWEDDAREVGAALCNDSRRPGGWRSGIPGGHGAPGLFLGRAGTGWTLLRIAHPEQVPSGWRLGPDPIGATPRSPGSSATGHSLASTSETTAPRSLTTPMARSSSA